MSCSYLPPYQCHPESSSRAHNDVSFGSPALSRTLQRRGTLPCDCSGRSALVGTIGASIMAPWVRSLEGRGGRVHARHRVRDLRVDAAGAATAVLADGPDGPCVRGPGWSFRDFTLGLTACATCASMPPAPPRRCSLTALMAHMCGHMQSHASWLKGGG